MEISSLLLYISLFVSLFFEVFLLITFFEVKEEIEFEKKLSGKLDSYPSATIIVPCFNEEKTVARTLHSLLELDYPKEKLNLMVVDDGSTDGTKEALLEFKDNPQVKIFKKENGGKHTALNFALQKIDSELVGCLDADSFVAPDALKKIAAYFKKDPAIQAVTPAVKVYTPKTVLQHVQKVEYSWGILFRRVLASINGLYVTPGPFSIFKREMFDKIGGYRHAHHTEDLEMAMRMQKHGLKIANASGAYVYTVGPEKLKSLYKQRVRWTYGFLNNVIDYREMLFNKKYGNVGIFVLPVATFSIFSSLYAAGTAVKSLVTRAADAIDKYQAVGWSWNFSAPHFTLNWFTFGMNLVSVLTIAAVLLSFTILYFSLQVAEGKARLSRGLVYYLTIYIFLVPLWLAKATYSTITRKSITWR